MSETPGIYLDVGEIPDFHHSHIHHHDNKHNLTSKIVKKAANAGNGNDHNDDIEIIDFYRPTGNVKNLFISNINVSLKITEDQDAAMNKVQVKY